MGTFRYQLFPRSFGITEQIREVIGCFEKNFDSIDSELFNYSSNEVLEIVRDDLESIGFKIEKSKNKVTKFVYPFYLV